MCATLLHTYNTIKKKKNYYYFQSSSFRINCCAIIIHKYDPYFQILEKRKKKFLNLSYCSLFSNVEYSLRGALTDIESIPSR